MMSGKLVPFSDEEHSSQVMSFNSVAKKVSNSQKLLSVKQSNIILTRRVSVFQLQNIFRRLGNTKFVITNIIRIVFRC